MKVASVDAFLISDGSSFQSRGVDRYIDKIKLGEYKIFVTIAANFIKIRSHVYLGQKTY